MQKSLSNQRPKYARICSIKYAENMQNMHKRNMQNICFICDHIQQYANHKYAFTCKYPYAKICKNMQKYAKLNIHQYAFLKYA